MSQIKLLNTDENVDFNKKQNDVDPSHETTMVTKALQAENDENEEHEVRSPSTDQNHEDNSVNISAGSTKYRSQESKIKRRTRRGKAKRGKSNSKPYSKTQWKFQIPRIRSEKKRSLPSLKSIRQSSDQPPLVPYNTNKFLMEDHMPHVTPSGRTRDSSFSIDSEDNYFYSLPEDEEEFLTKEFASVYEDARCERLEGMSKTQLIQEYLQLEATFEQLSRRYGAKFGKDTLDELKDTKDGVRPPGVMRMEDRIRDLTSENLELRRQLEHASRLGVMLSAKSSPRNLERMCSSTSNSTSEDSESDSSSSGSSSEDIGGNDESMMALGLDDEDAQPLCENYVKQNGCGHSEDDDEEAFSSAPTSPLSPSVSINSPTPLVIN